MLQKNLSSHRTSATLMLTVWFILLYAILVALGGILGYVKARSQPSLISGLVSGLLLAIAWYISLQTPVVGLAIATLIAFGLLGVFAVRFQRTRKWMPAGLMAILSLVAAIVFAIGWLSLRTA